MSVMSCEYEKRQNFPRPGWRLVKGSALAHHLKNPLSKAQFFSRALYLYITVRLFSGPWELFIHLISPISLGVDPKYAEIEAKMMHKYEFKAKFQSIPIQATTFESS